MKTEKNISVYLVDDNKVYLTTLDHYLAGQLLKVKLESFSSGEDCLKELEKDPTIEVVVLDYHLTDGSAKALEGLEVLKKIKEINPDIIVIMLSAEDKLKVAADCISSGAYEYVVKSQTAFIRTTNILRNLIHEVGVKQYYPVDTGGEA
jgi:two-component system OmpR family response regulator